MPDESTRAGVYESQAYYDLSEARRARIEHYAEERLNLLERLLGGPGSYSVLDIGCAAGIFLKRAHKRGWAVTGVEQSPRLATAARQSLPESCIYAGCIAQARLPRRGFDVICLWEVLEHNPDPLGLLRPLVPLLRAGGVLALSTPNLNSWAAWLLRERYPMLTPPEHVVYFSPMALKRLVQELRGRTLHWRSFGELLPEEAARGLRKLLSRAVSQHDPRPGVGGRWLLSLAQPALSVFNRLGWGLELEWYITFPATSAPTSERRAGREAHSLQ